MICCDPHILPGPLPHNEPVNLGMVSPWNDGSEYTFRIWFGGTAKEIKAVINQGDFIIMPVSDGTLNEDHIYQMQLFDPFGQQVKIEGKDCIQFQTFILRNFCNPCDDDDSSPIYPYNS